MKRILAAAVAATTALAVLAPASPALAAASITSITLSTNTAVINGDSGCGDRIKVTVTVHDPTHDSLGGHVEMSSATGGDSADYEIFNSSRSGDNAIYSTWLWLCGSATPGKYFLHILIYGLTTDLVSDTTPVWIKRPTSLTYNAAPEPARRGTSLTHSGRLMFDPFAPGGFYGPSGQVLQLAFKAAGSTTYVSKGTITTGTGGYYSRKVVTTGDGLWRLTFPTNTWRQTQVKWDYVDTTG